MHVSRASQSARVSCPSATTSWQRPSSSTWSPSTQAERRAVFTQVEGDRRPSGRNAGRIHVVIHRPEVWIWIIPFSNGRSSVGLVAPSSFYDDLPADPAACLRTMIDACPETAERLADADFCFEPNVMERYSAGVKELFGEGYCLVGNATEFLDPVLSSGVALAMQSARRAAGCVARQLHGEVIDWQSEYADYMRRGIDTFRTYVDAWYDGSLQRIFFAPDGNDEIKRMICSALAGYVWDEKNPFVRSQRKQMLRLIDAGARSPGQE